MPRIASYDVKCVLVEHLHEDMRRTRALRERIADFGVFAPEKRIEPHLSNLVRHLLQAPFDGALLGAFYRVVKVEQAAAYRRHLTATLRLNDAPTVIVLEDHLPKLDRHIAWARALLDGPALTSALLQETEAFEADIARHLAAIGGLFHSDGRVDGATAGAEPASRGWITGGSSIAELERALAGVVPAEEIAELTETARRTRANGAGRSPGLKARSDGKAIGHATEIPNYPQYVRPRAMALEPRFVRQTADRQRDEPWKEDVIVAAAYTHFTELPVIDVCAALVYDGRDITTLGADRGGAEVGEPAGIPEDPEEAARLQDSKHKYARAVQRAQAKRARGEGLSQDVDLGSGSEQELPFDYFCEFMRQTWDEVRHSRMGFERLQALGVDPYQVAIPLGHYAVWGNVHLRDRIASLTQVGEACSFKGKREWVKVAHERGEWLSALEHDYDMVDEKNHVRFGARWLPEILRRLGDPRTPEEVVQDADWTFRRRANALKRDTGEAWKEELGHRFLGCGTQTSDVTLAPEIIA